MFNFLNPALLIAAGAALIPLIIHLLSRRRVKIVEFSSLRHLKAMQRRQVRRLKIRQLLLLILRMLLVFILVLAFARPSTTSGAFGSQAAASSVVIMDNSSSMNRYVPNGELFDLARKRADALLAAFSTDDRVAILPLIADGNQPALVSPALAREQLAKISPTDGSASLRTALEQAAALLASSPSVNRELYLVTDRQRVLLPDSLVIDSAKLSGARLTVLDLPFDQPSNVGIRSVSLGTQLLSVGVPFNLTGKLTNSGTTDVKDLIVSLFIDDKRVSQATVNIPAGQDATVPFSVSVSVTGRHSGYLEISADHYPGDNRCYFGFRLPEIVSVLVIGDDPGGKLVRLALQPAPDAASYWSVKQGDQNALLSFPLDQFQVILLAGCPSLGDAGVERLNRFVASGKSVLVTIGEHSDRSLFQREYESLTGLKMEAPMPGVITRSGYYLLKSVAADHPIFNIFETNHLPQIKAFTLPTLHWRGQPGTALMTFTGDRLVMAERAAGRGKVITLGVPLDPSLSEFATTALFVPFMARTVEYLAADVSAYETDLKVGGVIRRPLPDGISQGRELELVRPDSSRRSIVPEFVDDRMSYSIANSRQAGIWKVVSDGREIDRVPLNVDPAESDLGVMPTGEFFAGFGLKEGTMIAASGEIGPILASLRYGRELWPLLLWFALALIAVELWLSRSTTADEEPG